MKPTKRLEKKLEKCKSVYIIGCWARFGVQEYKWTGRWKKINGQPVPVVWYYNDHNGAYEEWYKCPIICVTTAPIYTYCFNYKVANEIAEALNKYNKM